MRKYLFLISILLCSTLANAQVGKITKAKGNRALVQFPPGTKIHNGDSITLGSSGGGSDLSGSAGSREHSIGASFILSSGNTSPGDSHTSVLVSAQYGWNKVKMEYGPIASFATVSPANTTSFSAGGFFDYNLIPNAPGTDLVYGAGGYATIGTASGNGSSATAFTIFGGGFAKWFPLGNSVAARGDVGVLYIRSSASSTTTTQTDLLAKGGFEVYF